MWPDMDKKRRMVSVKNKEDSWKALVMDGGVMLVVRCWGGRGSEGGELLKKVVTALLTADTFDKMVSN